MVGRLCYSLIGDLGMSTDRLIIVDPPPFLFVPCTDII